MTSVAIIDYGSGNLRSAAKAFERVADKAEIKVTADPADLKTATHIVLPGVGAFADCMRGLTSLPGMRDALEKEVRQNKKPFLGICVGMQLLMTTGHEHGMHAGLGWIEGEVARIAATDQQLKIPHMGWNELTIKTPHPLLKNIAPKSHAYFVHSYHAKCKNRDCVIATTDYGGPIAAVIASGNIMGTQFHPEKSQDVGLQILKNFLEI